MCLRQLSAEPRKRRDHIGALHSHGVEAIDLGVTIDNVDRLMRDEALVEQIAALRTIVPDRGNQIRLVESLLYRGEVGTADERHCAGGRRAQ